MELNKQVLLSGLFLFFLILLSGCAKNMQMSTDELQKLSKDEGIVFGSLLIKGGKDILGRTAWEFVAVGVDNGSSSLTTKEYSVKADRGSDEEVFITKMPAGKYRFTLLRQLGFSSFTSDLNETPIFRVQAGKNVYIGRYVIEFPPTYITKGIAFGLLVKKASTKFRIYVEDAKQAAMDIIKKKHGINLSDALNSVPAASLPEQVFKSCFAQEIKQAKKMGKNEPRVFAHYVCVFYKRTCNDKLEDVSCKKALERYGVRNVSTSFEQINNN